jgi:tetratricopeptide (TPR) repeat protein
VGKGYVLAASLVSAGDGSVLTAVRETARDDGELLGAIDRLSRKLRERVGESLVSIRGNPSLDQVTTGSLPALRKYSAALRLEEEDKSEAAIPLLQEAVALDTGFAMAYRKLAVIMGNLGHEAERTAAATHAYAHRDRLPELESDLTIGYYHQFVDYDPPKVVAAYRAALSVDPDNLVALNNLAVALQQERHWPEAESLAVRASRLGRSAAFFGNSLAAQVAQGHFDDAERTIARFAEKAPASPSTLYYRAGLAIARGDYAAGTRMLEQLRAAQGASPEWQSRTSIALAHLSRLTGRIADSERYLRENMAQSETQQSAGQVVSGAAELALLQLDFRGRGDSGLAILAGALGRHPLAGIPAPDRPYSLLIATLAQLGRPEQARRLLLDYAATVPESMRRGDALRHYAEGMLAEAEHRPAEAAAAYRSWNEESADCTSCGLFDLARLEALAGRTDSAIALYDRGLSQPSMSRWLDDAYALAPALKRSGELYEARGDRAKAAERYRRFVDLWKGADPELQPGVREIRARLARLSAEPGT